MNENDIKLLTMLKLRVDRAFSFEKTRIIKDRSPHSISEFESLLKDLECDVAICVSRINVSKLRSGRRIYNELLSCWLKDLRYLIELTSPSNSLKEFINIYVERFRIIELLQALKELRANTLRKEDYVLINVDELDLTSVRFVHEFLNNMKELYPISYKVLLKVLMSKERASIKELDLSVLKEQAVRILWSLILISASKLRPSIKLTPILNYLRDTDSLELSLRKAYAEGRDLSSYLRMGSSLLTKTLSQVVQKSPLDTDIVLNIARYVYPINELRYCPLTYDKVLEYLVVKELETHLISQALYMLSNLGVNYLINNIEAWWERYERISGSA